MTALQFLVQKKRSGSVNKRERELKESTLTSSLRESKREERETGSLSPDPEDSGKRRFFFYSLFIFYFLVFNLFII